MDAKVLDGKAIAEGVLDEVKSQVDKRIAAGKPAPGLAVILVGDNPASQVYVRNKIRSCEKTGIRSIHHTPAADISQSDMLALIDKLNADPTVNGILVQLPVPDHLDEAAIIQRIDPKKDVDGFHPVNIGLLLQRNEQLRPCTPRGIMTMLARTGIELSGLDAVIIGQSNIVGRPMLLELLNARCTPMICHSRTKDLQEKTSRADILVVATGQPEMVRGDWIKPGAIVIDVGINRTDDGRLVGDVHFDSAKEVASWITPVPGGVGPMTVATLMQNTITATELQDSKA